METITSMADLLVNIDHIATLRNQRNTQYPSLEQAVRVIESAGAVGITSHLREDRRHIRDEDIVLLKKIVKGYLNMEMAPTLEMLNIALEVQPDKACIVPEKRKELTTEGGLNLDNDSNFLEGLIKKLEDNGTEVSLFIEPNIDDISKAKELGAHVVELHTGAYANTVLNSDDFKRELKRIQEAIILAKGLGLKVNLGHGLDYDNIVPLTSLNEAKLVSEYNIGFSIISMSIFWGLELATKKMLNLINEA